MNNKLISLAADILAVGFYIGIYSTVGFEFTVVVLLASILNGIINLNKKK